MWKHRTFAYKYTCIIAGIGLYYLLEPWSRFALYMNKSIYLLIKHQGMLNPWAPFWQSLRLASALFTCDAGSDIISRTQDRGIPTLQQSSYIKYIYSVKHMGTSLDTIKHFPFQLLPWIIQVSRELSLQDCSSGERSTPLITSLNLSQCHYYLFSLEKISLTMSCYTCRKTNLACNSPLNWRLACRPEACLGHLFPARRKLSPPTLPCA